MESEPDFEEAEEIDSVCCSAFLFLMNYLKAATLKNGRKYISQKIVFGKYIFQFWKYVSFKQFLGNIISKFLQGNILE